MSDHPRHHRGEDPAAAPAPEDERKPDTPAQITRPSWRYVLRTTVREFSADGCMDLAAGLTYRSVLSLFPTLIALVSILSLLGQSGKTLTAVFEEVRDIVPSETWDTLGPVLDALLTAPAPGLGLIVGLLTAVWAAAGYVKAFGRAMNTIYDVPEGRGPIKLSAQMLGLTVLVLVLGSVAIVVFVVSGPIAEAVGAALGMGSAGLMVWNVVKWFALAFMVVLVVALLYHATPNVRQPRFRWVSIGAVIAIAVSVVATLGFFFYVSNFSNYDATYGALAGVIILLLWFYIINAILLFGAEFDSEVERARQLQAGIEAEEELQLPARDTKANDKKQEKFEQDLEHGRNLRLSRGASMTDPGAEEPGTDRDSSDTSP